MSTLKKTTDELTSWLEGHDVIQQTSVGDISEIDLSGYTKFPLVHTIYLNTTYPNGVRTFNYQILFLNTCINDEDKLEIISAMDEVAAELVASIYGGSIFRNKVRTNTTPTSEVMYDQLKNRLYGVSLTLSVKVPYGCR